MASLITSLLRNHTTPNRKTLRLLRPGEEQEPAAREAALFSELLEVGMHWTPGSGGVDRYFHGLMTAFHTSRVPAHALAFDGEQLDITKHAKYRSLGSKHLGCVERMRRLRTSARCFEKEAVNKSIIATHFAFYALPMYRQLQKHRHIVHFHGPWADESSQQGGRPHVVLAKRSIERLVYSTAKTFITLSHAFKDVLTNRYKIPANRVVVIPGGIDADSFNLAESRAVARRKLDWPQNRRIVLCVRRLVPRMGLEQLLTAIKDVCQAIPDGLLLIAGEGSLRNSLETRISAAGLTGHVRLLGFIPDGDLARAYKAADLSIVPSQSLEGFGLVTLESLASGTPVLVTPVDGLPEAVARLSDHLVLRSASANHIAEGLITALSEKLPMPDDVQCKQYVRKNFDWSVIAPRILDVYNPAASIIH